MKIYVAGPYTAPDARSVAMNVDRAIRVACKLIRLGHEVFLPHLNHYIWTHPDGDFDYEVWLRIDLAFLACCDAIFVIDESPGVRRELELAWKLGLKEFRKIEDVPSAWKGAIRIR